MMDKPLDTNEAVNMVGLRALAKQVDRLEKWLERVEESKIPEMAKSIQEIKLKLATNFVSTDDCKDCRVASERMAAAGRATWRYNLTLLVSLAAVAVAIAALITN